MTGERERGRAEPEVQGGHPAPRGRAQVVRGFLMNTKRAIYKGVFL